MITEKGKFYPVHMWDKNMSLFKRTYSFHDRRYAQMMEVDNQHWPFWANQPRKGIKMNRRGDNV